jgi:hypothetical protein
MVDRLRGGTEVTSEVAGTVESMGSLRGSDEHPSRTSRTWRFIRENVAVTLTVVGLLVYTSLRLSAGVFYGRFGFTPEDVGLGYAEILARSLYTLILLTIYGGILIFATLWLAASVAFVVERASGSIRKRSRNWEARRSLVSRGKEFVRLWPALTALTVLAIPVIAAAFEADSVEKGRPVRQSDWALPFAWDAPAAVVTRADGESDGRCVIYLGNAGGFVALYDPADASSLRLPTSGTTVRTGGPLANIGNVPGDCPPLGG